MKSRLRLALLALAALLICIAASLLVLPHRQPPEHPLPAPAAPVKRPNVVLISLDTVRPDHLGCYGYGKNTSPNLDAFARESVLFKNAYAQAPWTLPSHMSLFTSMLPSHNRVEDINERLAKDIPTLAELMRAGGYSTAALVNNGQMMAHWGFARGFDLWREYQVDTPAGNCENITREALAWFEARPREPFFLFLHYFDAHDPYDPPPQYLEAFGSTVAGDDARAIVWEHRLPGDDIKDERLLNEIIGAYDAEIAWLDAELGKFLRALPADTIVVVFSDHGEAFEEHGWTTHGAALYEEEVRVALMVRAPGVQARTAEAPVMLLDVAPTILALSGLKGAPQHEGCDLTPLLRGRGAIPDRPIASETKRHLEGRVLKMFAKPPWKLIYSLCDARVELYKLPDEHADMAQTETVRAAELLKPIREWMAVEDYWMLYAKGEALHEATLTTQGGRFNVFIPVGFDLERDDIRPSRDGTEVTVAMRPGKSVKALYFEVSPRNAPVRFDLKVDGERNRAEVSLPGQPNPESLPFELDSESPALDAFIEKPFTPERDGFHVIHYRGSAATGRPVEGVELDAKTIELLRSLGYVR